MTDIGAGFSLPEGAAALLGDSEHRTFSGSRSLFREAANQFNVGLDPQEDEDWRALLSGAALIDYLLDVEKVDIMPALTGIISGEFRSDLHARTQLYFRDYMLKQPEAYYEDILSRLSQVNSMADRQREATKVQEVIDVRLEEADLVTHLLSLRVEGKPDVNERLRFNSWLSGWSRGGYMLDSLRDMRLDFNNGDSGVKPTPLSVAHMAVAATKELAIGLKKTPPSLIGKCALVAVKYVGLTIKQDVKTTA